MSPTFSLSLSCSFVGGEVFEWGLFFIGSWKPTAVMCDE
jgi:hypothetical protein